MERNINNGIYITKSTKLPCRVCKLQGLCSKKKKLFQSHIANGAKVTNKTVRKNIIDLACFFQFIFINHGSINIAIGIIVISLVEVSNAVIVEMNNNFLPIHSSFMFFVMYIIKVVHRNMLLIKSLRTIASYQTEGEIVIIDNTYIILSFPYTLKIQNRNNEMQKKKLNPTFPNRKNGTWKTGGREWEAENRDSESTKKSFHSRVALSEVHDRESTL